MKRIAWSIAWRLWNLWCGLRYPNRPGGHRLVGRQCLCGHRTTDDPERCTLWVMGQ